MEGRKVVHKYMISDKIAAADLVRKVASKQGDHCIYSDGWNDKRVAKELGYPTDFIIRIRLAVLGELPPKVKTGRRRPPAMAARIVELEARVLALEALVTSPTFTPEVAPQLPLNAPFGGKILNTPSTLSVTNGSHPAR